VSREKDYEDLSALLDGETPHPETVRRHLMQDPDLARRYESYEALSEAIQSLEAPQVTEDFTDRVMATTRETQRLPRRPFQDTHPARWAAAAVILNAVAVGLYMFAPDPASRPTQEARLEDPMDAPVDLEDSAFGWEELDTLDTTQFASLMADLIPESEEAYDVADEGPDLFEVMDMMEDLDEAVLSDLLRDYMREG
jgi:hypothetical protein